MNPFLKIVMTSSVPQKDTAVALGLERPNVLTFQQVKSSSGGIVHCFFGGNKGYCLKITVNVIFPPRFSLSLQIPQNISRS